MQPESVSAPSAPHGWFIADVSITSATLWLCVWRWKLVLAAGTQPGVWGTWIPAVTIPAIVVVAAVIGAVRPKAIGFLPYVLRWVFVTCGLGLLLWIGVDLRAVSALAPTSLAGVAARAEQEVDAAMTAASSPERRRRLEQAKEAASTGAKLGAALERARASGVDVPGGTVKSTTSTSTSTPTPADELREVTELLREYGVELAEGRAPPELAPFLKEAGIDGDAALRNAAVFLASRAIAAYFGIQYAIVFELLMKLLDDGELTLGELVRLGTACAMAITPSGGFDAELLAESFERVGVQAASAVVVMEALRAADVDVPEELLNVAKQASGAGVASDEPSACDAAALQRAFEAAGCKPAGEPCSARRVEELVRHSDVEACRRLSRADRERLVQDFMRERADRN